MADLELLLAAIYARPEDDLARSVYADALQEIGDPRGEFISLQLHQPTNPRARDLSTKFAVTWLGELAPVVLASEWKRGFLDKVVVDIFKSSLFPRLANKREWTTLRVVELGGQVASERAYAIPTHQKLVLEMLMKAPGAATRKFQPSYTEIQAGGTDARYLLR